MSPNRPSAQLLGEVMGRAQIDPRVLYSMAWATARAGDFYAHQLEAGFMEMVATEDMPTTLRKLHAMPDAIELKRAGYRRRSVGPRSSEVILTCSVGMHEDRCHGLVCLVTLHNDALEFSQKGGAKRVDYQPGQWTVFDDYASHQMEPGKKSPDHGVYIGLAVPVEKIKP